MDKYERELADLGCRLVHAHNKVDTASYELREYFKDYRFTDDEFSLFTLGVKVDELNAWFERYKKARDAFMAHMRAAPEKSL